MSDAKKETSLVGTINQTMQENKVTQLAPGRVQSAESSRNVWCVTPEPGTPADALLDPKYFCHYATNSGIRIGVLDRFECFAEDGAYFIELLVRNVFRGGINVIELRRVNLKGFNEQTAEELGDFEIKWSGPKLKWSVVRNSDARRMTEGLDSREKATDWLRNAQKSWAA